MVEERERIGFELGMGWLPDYPDFRDYTIEYEETGPLIEKIGVPIVPEATTVRISNKANLRAWCSPIENQGALGSCTAHAGVGLVEYYERRAFGKHIDASRLFLCKVTGNLLNSKGDTGAFIR